MTKEKMIEVVFQSYRDLVGTSDYPYIQNKDGSINLVGKLFGVVNTHIPKRYLDYDENGIPVSTMICVHDGEPNRLY